MGLNRTRWMVLLPTRIFYRQQSFNSKCRTSRTNWLNVQTLQCRTRLRERISWPRLSLRKLQTLVVAITKQSQPKKASTSRRRPAKPRKNNTQRRRQETERRRREQVEILRREEEERERREEEEDRERRRREEEEDR